MTTWTKEGTKGSSDTTYSASDILLKSDDPDITLDINTASSSSRAELRFSEEGDEKGYIGYHKGDNVLKITTTDSGQNESIAIIPEGTGGVGIGTDTPNALVTIEGTLSMKEQSDDAAHVAGYGQIWVDDAGNGTLMFTNDAGTKYTVDVTAV